MNKIYFCLLILLINFIGFSQGTHVQIDFVTGFNIYVTNTYPESPSEGTQTSNSEINSIFSIHSVNHCVSGANASQAIIFADYNGTNLNGFISDLLSNNNVLTAKICYNSGIYSYTYANLLYVKLLSNANGNPIGLNGNGNITTTNAILNIIYDNYNTKTMTQSSSLWYQISFDGDITLLRNELNSLNSVIEATDLVGVPMLLNNPEFNTSLDIIYPNPFSSEINIDSKEIITNYTLIDITGKEIVNCITKPEFDNQITKLQSSFYFLKLQFENGKTSTHKIIKE